MANRRGVSCWPLTGSRLLCNLQSLPRVDALGSRQFLLHLLPSLCTVPSSIRPLQPAIPTRRIRAVDVGAGVGRVTSDVLLHLVQDVVLVEPVTAFIGEAVRRGTESENGTLVEDTSRGRWKGIQSKEKSVTFIQGTLQDFDPASPLRSASSMKLLKRVGYQPREDDMNTGFDVIWCQWCLGHLTDIDLIAFFKRCRAALRDPDQSLIIVKENICNESDDGQAQAVFDPSDSSLTRYGATS